MALTLPHEKARGSAETRTDAVVRTVGRLPELDGVRAIAILAVLATHFFSNERTAPAAKGLHGFAAAAYQVAAHGWLGVDLFFVLSGFLITGILLDSRNRVTYFRDFWLRRALRILPLVIVVVAVLTLIYRPSWLYVVMAFFFSVDLAQLFGLGNRPLGPMWSLAVEEQFYFVWPLLVLWLPRRALTLVTLGVLLIEPVLRLSTGGPVDLPWLRLDGLAMGALIAIYVRSRYFSRSTTLHACVAALAIAAVLIFTEVGAHVEEYGLRITEACLIFGAIIAAAVALPGHPWLAMLRSRQARFVADTSFCVYLIHIALQDLARYFLAGRNPVDPFVSAALQAAIAIPAAFIIAALSRRYLELPFLRLKNRFAPGTTMVPNPAADTRGRRAERSASLRSSA